MSDLLGLLDIFHPRNFGCLRPKTTFSTATPDNVSHAHFKLGGPKRPSLTPRGQYLGNRIRLIMDDMETLTVKIEQLQGKYTVAVKAYGAIKNAAERENAKALIASLGKQIDDLKRRLKALP